MEWGPKIEDYEKKNAFNVNVQELCRIDHPPPKDYHVPQAL